MKFLTVLLVGCFMSLSSFAALTTAQEYMLNNYMGPVANKVSLGTEVKEVKKVAKIIFDVALTGKDSAGKTIGHGSTGFHKFSALPDNAVITNVFVDVITPFTTGGTTSVGFVYGTSQAITFFDIASSAGAPWSTAGFKAGHQDGTLAAYSKTASATDMYVTVYGDAALSAGKAVFFVEYVVSE